MPVTSQQELDASLCSFYAQDPRRARSPERDLGLRWRARDGSSYRAAWVEETGELYTVRHGSRAADDRLDVLARLDKDALERGLAGWRAVCEGEKPGSYEWLRERAAAARRPAHRGPARLQRSRRRRAAMLRKAPWTARGWRGQPLLYLSAYTADSATRWIVVGDPVRASAHAALHPGLEQALHPGGEGAVQRALAAGVPIWLLNHPSLIAQFAVVPGALIWLYAHAPAIYRRLRDTVLATWLIAIPIHTIPIHALFPVAPPRLARIGIVDTISTRSPVNLGSHLMTGFDNPHLLHELSTTPSKGPQR